MVRYAFNRYLEGKTEKEIMQASQTLNNMPRDSWFIQCAIKKANYLYLAQKDTSKVIFGGKFNFFQRLKNKIEKKKFQQNRLLAIYSQGEKLKYGNRKFELDIVNNKIIFKFSSKKKIILHLPMLHKNYQRELMLLDDLSHKKILPFSVELRKNTENRLFVIM